MSPRHFRRKRIAGCFAMLPLTVLDKAAVKTLSHAAFRVLLLMAAQYNGGNNGALGITRIQAAANGIGSHHTLYGALRTLAERGLIEQTYPASRVPPRPTKYALTWMSVDDTSWSRSTRIPTHTYRDWQPPRKPKLRIVKDSLKDVRKN